MNEEYNLLVDQSGQTDNLAGEPSSVGNSQIALLSMEDSYNGTITDSYLDYFTGIVSKLPFQQHYLVWRVNQNEYAIAYGSELSVNGYVFTGSDLWVTRLYRSGDTYANSWLVSHSIDDLEIDVSTLFAYSDLTEYLPTLKRGWSSVESTALFFSFVCFSVFYLIRDIFKSVSK